MSDKIDSNVLKCIALAQELSVGTMTVSDGALAILDLIHDNRAESAKGMADAILGKKS